MYLFIGIQFSAVYAETPAQFTFKSVPLITPVTNFVEQAQGTSYHADGNLELTIKLTDTARKLRKNGFQIRVFRLPSNDFKPMHWEYFEPCYVYLSSVYRFVGRSGSSLTIPIGDAWLEAVHGEKMKPGRWLLVFEQMSDENQVFRLHKDYKDEYFKSGLIVVVNTTRKYSEIEIKTLANLLSVRQQQLMSEINVNSRNRPCYKYNVIKANSESNKYELASLLLCEDDIYHHNPETFPQ